MTSTLAELLTPDEASIYLLYNKSPGLSQDEIAAEKGLDQGTVSRILKRATAKVEEMKVLVDTAGGDVGVIDTFLMRTEVKPVSRHPSRITREEN